MKLRVGAYGGKGWRAGGGGGGGRGRVVVGLMPATKYMTGAMDSHCARRNPRGLFLRTLVGYAKLVCARKKDIH